MSNNQLRFTVSNISASDSINIGRHNFNGTNRTFIVGDLNSAKSYANYAFGKGLMINRSAPGGLDRDASLVFGKWNVQDSSKAIVIGNGTGPDDRRNALTIDDDNHVAIVTDPVNDMDVVPYKMLHRIIRDTSGATTVTLAKAQRERTYVFGTLTSLTVNEFDSTGICDIIFRSGSTATTVTLPAGIKLPKDFA